MSLQMRRLAINNINMKISVIENTKTIHALNPQKKIGVFDFPFTANLCIGCAYACKYCFIPIVLHRQPSCLFPTVEVKVKMPTLFQQELQKLASIPQHLKRIQINESSDPYNPFVMHFMEHSLPVNPLIQLYETMKNEWANGNKWILHILTKSNLITRHIPFLEQIKEMVQIEMSFCSSDESISRSMEPFTPTIKKRLDAIEQLAKKDLFVRVMAMPFYDDHADTEAFRTTTLNYGALAFKHKQLNYYDWQTLSQTSVDDLLNDRLKRSTGKNNQYFADLLLRSGEPILTPGKTNEVIVLMPELQITQSWAVPSRINQRLTQQTIQLVDMGYSKINTVDWKYIK